MIFFTNDSVSIRKCGVINNFIKRTTFCRYAFNNGYWYLPYKNKLNDIILSFNSTLLIIITLVLITKIVGRTICL